MSVRERLEIIRQQVSEACKKANRNPDDIKLIAVTKYVSNATAKEAIDAGIVHIGENRDDGLQKKWEELQHEQCTWHFIGTLQSRKVKHVVNIVDYIHSLDRISLAKEIEKRAERKIRCFVQVNASGEQSKHGLAPDQVISFIKELEQFTKIEVVGLMTMAPYTDDEQILRKTFQTVRALQHDVQALGLPHAPCAELSMGMSNDFQIAIEEGATFIRIGTALVGKEF